MKRVSIRDVAKAAGVSITTVSKALNGYPDVNPDTKKHIEELVREMNYVPDMAGRRMGGISVPAIGLLINDLKQEEPSGAVYGFLSGVCAACRDRNVDFLLLTTDAKAQKRQTLRQLCLSKNLSGLVCSGFRMDDPYIAQLGSAGIPCALIDLKVDDANVESVTIDNVAAAALAVNHLIRAGNRKIVMLCGNKAVDVSNYRVKGYRKALEAAGIPFDSELVCDANFDQHLAYEKAKLLLTEQKPDAVFCASDLMAAGVCQAAEELGLTLGTDVSVVGFDDIPIAQFIFGGITTIRQNFYAMGYQAGRIIYGKIQGSEVDKSSDKMLYQLVVRKTAP